MHLSSSKGPIDVFLCTDASESSSPLRNGVDVNGNDTAFLRMSRGEPYDDKYVYENFFLHRLEDMTGSLSSCSSLFSLYIYAYIHYFSSLYLYSSVPFSWRNRNGLFNQCKEMNDVESDIK